MGLQIKWFEMGVPLMSLKGAQLKNKLCKISFFPQNTNKIKKQFVIYQPLSLLYSHAIHHIHFLCLPFFSSVLIVNSHQGHPEDIFPMVLTSATQELFGCRADEDVTGENPYKLLKKDDIIQDTKTRAAVSDFSPVKQTVLVRLIHCCADHSDNTPKTLWWCTDPTLRAVGTHRVTSLTSIPLTDLD